MKKTYRRQLCCPPPTPLKLGHFGQVLSGWQTQARAIRPVARSAPSALGQPASRLRPSRHRAAAVLNSCSTPEGEGDESMQKNLGMTEEEAGERNVLPSPYSSFSPQALLSHFAKASGSPQPPGGPASSESPRRTQAAGCRARDSPATALARLFLCLP